MPMYFGPDGQKLKILDVRIGHAELPEHFGVRQAIVLEWQDHKLLMSRSELIEIQKMLNRGLEIIDEPKGDN